jgi:hypothetical protein
MIIKRFINWFFSDNDDLKGRYKIICYDKKDTEYSLIELLQQLTQHVIKLEERIRILEEENVSTTNELYRMENSLDARIDIIAERCGINYDV